MYKSALIISSLLLSTACKDPGDEDGDGFHLDDGDCDDLNAAVYPGAPEQCDGVDDNDCGSDTHEVNVPGDFETIQEGLDNRDEQSLVCIEAGTYTENLSITGSATVVGVAGSEQTVVEGVTGETILGLYAGSQEISTITLSGLSINGTTDEDSWAIHAEGVTATLDDLSLSTESVEHMGFYSYQTELTLSNLTVADSACTDRDCWAVLLDDTTADLRNISITNSQSSGIMIYNSSATLEDVELKQLGDTTNRAAGILQIISSSVDLSHISVSENNPASASVLVSDTTLTFDHLGIVDNTAASSNHSEAGLTVETSQVVGAHLWVENNGGRWGAVVADYSSFSVTNMVVINNSGYGFQQYYVDDDTDTNIRQALVAGNGQLGMRVYGPLTLTNAIVAGHEEDGLIVTDKATLSHITVFANQVPGDNMSANVEVGTKKVTMSNSIVADGLWGFSGPYNGGTKLTLKWVDVWGHDEGNATDWNGLNNSLPGTGGMSVNPKFVSTGSETPAKWDLRLKSSSPLIDQGDPDAEDPDGSPSDLGAFSGPNAGNFDLDGDGINAWWGPYDHPGAPWDCDDMDPDIQNECW